MLWACAVLNVSPDPAWLQQHMQEVSKRQLQKTLEPQHYGNIGWALAKLGHRCVGYAGWHKHLCLQGPSSRVFGFLVRIWLSLHKKFVQLTF